ncbi:MAG TPA: hypothetical protein VKP67_00850 [Xanthobacteraceae bacterium]|nr:hypothetical protein [Xanthobacteraceae bacterium]
MTLFLTALIVSLTVLPATVLGEQVRADRVEPHRIAVKEEGHLGTPQQQRACRPDVLRHCRSMSDDYAMADCLKANEQKLSAACRRALETK